MFNQTYTGANISPMTILLLPSIRTIKDNIVNFALLFKTFSDAKESADKYCDV